VRLEILSDLCGPPHVHGRLGVLEHHLEVLLASPLGVVDQKKRAQHALRVRINRALREVGMTTAQYAALSTLEVGPGQSGADYLEAVGLVVRRPHPEHGRVLQAYLTEIGEESVARAHGLVEAVE
jgi:hypothetical protein